jgi:hypothetical protein
MPRAELIDWLSSEQCPPVRYLTARDFIDPAASKATLAKLRAEMLAWPPLKRILARQRDDGAFPWTQKARTAQPTFAALELMAACGMDVRDEPVSRALAALGAYHQPKKHPGLISYLSGGSGVVPCYLGLAARSLIALGALEHPLVQGSIQWLVEHQRFDHKATRAGGPATWPYATPKNVGCWESVSCYHGVVAALRTLGAVPAKRRSSALRERLGEAIQYLRIHRVYHKSREDKPVLRHLTKFFLVGEYRSDLIDVLEGLADADPTLSAEPWVRQAIDAVDALTVNGRVLQLRSYAHRLAEPLDFEPMGEPSRFLTLQWIRVKRCFGLA